ncbi:YeiH family protein [Streptomyces sp. NPDC091219]|uniref:YeiH family protein n=1 Tax=Streptomyces sp. NPDC091219 TaxID=3155193 RepID=UPI00344E91A7
MTSTQRRPGGPTPPARHTPATDPRRLTAPGTKALRLVPGLAACAAIAAVATGVGTVAPLVGAPVIGILIGALWRVRLGIRPVLLPGVARAKGFVLQLAVVLLGTQLSLAEIAQVGASSLPVMLGTLAACLGVAYLVGRWLRIGADLRTLIGVGTAICGASAIAAVSPVIKAKSNDIAYAVSTIFLFNVAAVLVFPPLGHLLGMSQSDFGLFAGTAVNDTSSVVAAASSYGHAAADHAVVVKLVRSLMIIPICLALAALVRRRETRTEPATAGGKVNPFQLVPWFLVGFLLTAAANTVGLLPHTTHAALSHTALFLITTALAGIGLSTNITELRRTGPRPVVLGMILWATVAATSLLLQLVVG